MRKCADALGCTAGRGSNEVPDASRLPPPPGALEVAKIEEIDDSVTGLRELVSSLSKAVVSLSNQVGTQSKELTGLTCLCTERFADLNNGMVQLGYVQSKLDSNAKDIEILKIGSTAKPALAALPPAPAPREPAKPSDNLDGILDNLSQCETTALSDQAERLSILENKVASISDQLGIGGISLVGKTVSSREDMEAKSEVEVQQLVKAKTEAVPENKTEPEKEVNAEVHADVREQATPQTDVCDLRAGACDLRAELLMEIESLRSEIESRLEHGVHSPDTLPEGADGKTQQSSQQSVELRDNSSNWRKEHNEIFEAWSFQNTCWDAAVFFGNFQVLMPMESVGIMVLLLASIIMQAGFTCIVLLSFGYSSFDEETIEGYHWWRTNIGHSTQFMDPLTMESLASRVCRGDSSLHLSEAQSWHVQKIHSFLDQSAPFNGPMMCTLALTTWILTIFTQFRALIDKVMALANIPITSRTVLCLTIDKFVEVKSLSRMRVCYLADLIILQTLILVVLLVAGIRYLVVTISIEELVLNSVALEFILNADELLYEALAPTATHAFMTSVKPLQAKRLKSFRGLGVVDIFRAVGIIISSVLAYQIGLAPELNKMKQARRELCAGDLTFEYSVSAGGFVQWAATTNDVSPEQKLDSLSRSSRYALLRGLIEGSNSNRETTNVFKLTSSDLRKVSSQTIVYIGDRYNAKCTDKLMSNFYTGADFNAQTRALVALRDAIGNQSISACHEVERYCNQEQMGMYARVFCPETCGCQSPGSALIYQKSAEGCPSLCAEKTSYVEPLASTPCVDLANNASILGTFAANLQIAVETRPSTFRERVERLSELFSSQGCNAEGIDELCRLSNLKSLSFFCPVRCRCNVTKHEMCPLTC